MASPAIKRPENDQALDPTALLGRDFWHAFAPQLHIADAGFFQNIAAFDVGPDHGLAIGELLRTEGYFQGFADCGVDLALMVSTVRALADANLSPVFAFLYDEFWLPFAKLHLLYGHIIGANYQVLPDFWIWNVDPKRGEAGWKPHRDKGRTALLPD